MKIFLPVIVLTLCKPCFSQSKIFEQLNNNSFKIECYKDSRLSKTGSGFILRQKLLADGNYEYICLSNEHVLDNTDSAFVVFNEYKFPIAGALQSIHKLDAVVFTFFTKVKFQGLLNNVSYNQILNYKPEIGESIYTMSSPKGLLNTLSNGIVSSFRKDEYKNLIQISAPISHGSSGGVVVNNQGLPIGIIVSQYSEGQNLNFCVPLKDVFQNLKQKKILDDNFNFKEINFTQIKNLTELIIQGDSLLNIIEQARGKNNELMFQLIFSTPEDYLPEIYLFGKIGHLAEQKNYFGEFKTTLFCYQKYKSVFGKLSLLSICSNSITKNRLDIPIDYIKTIYNNNEDIFLDLWLKRYLGHYFYSQKNYSKSIDYLNPIRTFFDQEIDDTAKFSRTERNDFILLRQVIQPNVLNMLAYSFLNVGELAEAEDCQKGVMINAISVAQDLTETKGDKNRANQIVADAAKRYLYYCARANIYRNFCAIYNLYLKNYAVSWDATERTIINQHCK